MSDAHDAPRLPDEALLEIARYIGISGDAMMRLVGLLELIGADIRTHLAQPRGARDEGDKLARWPWRVKHCSGAWVVQRLEWRDPHVPTIVEEHGPFDDEVTAQEVCAVLNRRRGPLEALGAQSLRAASGAGDECYSAAEFAALAAAEQRAADFEARRAGRGEGEDVVRRIVADLRGLTNDDLPEGLVPTDKTWEAIDWIRERIAAVANLPATETQPDERFGFTYCAYCGERFPADAPEGVALIEAHIRICEHHPVHRWIAETTAQARAAAWNAAADELWPKDKEPPEEPDWAGNADDYAREWAAHRDYHQAQAFRDRAQAKGEDQKP